MLLAAAVTQSPSTQGSLGSTRLVPPAVPCVSAMPISRKRSCPGLRPCAAVISREVCHGGKKLLGMDCVKESPSRRKPRQHTNNGFRSQFMKRAEEFHLECAKEYENFYSNIGIDAHFEAGKLPQTAFDQDDGKGVQKKGFLEYEEVFRDAALQFETDREAETGSRLGKPSNRFDYEEAFDRSSVLVETVSHCEGTLERQHMDARLCDGDGNLLTNGSGVAATDDIPIEGFNSDSIPPYLRKVHANDLNADRRADDANTLLPCSLSLKDHIHMDSPTAGVMGSLVASEVKFSHHCELKTKSEVNGSIHLSRDQKIRTELNKAAAIARRNLRTCENSVADAQANGICFPRFKKLLVEKTWLDVIQGEFEKPYMERLFEYVCQEAAGSIPIYPPPAQVFNAFNSCPLDKVKVVVLGQDPYHGPGQAMGLSFSVAKGIKIPTSLMNIFKEIKNDLNLPIPSHGNLEKWAHQGVLLLNSVLTVRDHHANSHAKKGWEAFTDAAIRAVVHHQRGIVFLLWGNAAQDKLRYDTSSTQPWW